jgi:hypothetical protein
VSVIRYPLADFAVAFGSQGSVAVRQLSTGDFVTSWTRQVVLNGPTAIYTIFQATDLGILYPALHYRGLPQPKIRPPLALKLL